MKYRFKYVDKFVGLAVVEKRWFGFLWLRDWFYPVGMEDDVRRLVDHLNGKPE